MNHIQYNDVIYSMMMSESGSPIHKLKQWHKIFTILIHYIMMIDNYDVYTCSCLFYRSFTKFRQKRHVLLKRLKKTFIFKKTTKKAKSKKRQGGVYNIITVLVNFGTFFEKMFTTNVYYFYFISAFIPCFFLNIRIWNRTFKKRHVKLLKWLFSKKATLSWTKYDWRQW